MFRLHNAHAFAAVKSLWKMSLQNRRTKRLSKLYNFGLPLSQFPPVKYFFKYNSRPYTF